MWSHTTSLSGRQGVLRNRHFAGDAVSLRLEDGDGRPIAIMVLDEEALHGDDSAVVSEDELQLRVGSVDLHIWRVPTEGTQFPYFAGDG